MERRGSKAQKNRCSPADDDLGRLIRWSVPDLIRRAEPPEDVWPRIVERVRAGPAGERPAPSQRRASFPLAPFVQAVVISTLLLAFGLGVDRSFVVPRQGASVASTPVMAKARAMHDTTDDMLSGYMLVHGLPEEPVRRGGNLK